MTVHELLQHEVFDLPVNWVDVRYHTHSGREYECPSYYHFVVKQLSRYQRLLKELAELPVMGSLGMPTLPTHSNADLVRMTVRTLCIGIVRTLIAYAKGSPSTAYQTLCEGLEPRNKPRLIHPAANFNTCSASNRDYYRLRSATYDVTNPQGLFHLPFELRYRVKPYRYSIAGYPSLYVASSPELALRELHQDTWTPDLYAARLRVVDAPIKDVRLLDLRNRIEELRSRYTQPTSDYDGQVMRFLCSWPLIMATSVPTGHPPLADERGCLQYPGFNEEYVLPQLVLEWVYNSRNRNTPYKLAGIAFSSARISLRDPTFAGAFNIVVPAEQPSRSGYCSIRIRQFEISTPVSIRTLLTEWSELPATDFAQQLAQRLTEQDYHSVPIQRGTGA
ncbi:MAG: RES domain-containing protein [Hymenobacter sp.]|nr:MAG: RES domain-containing protein [Hymenobacter sp.]